MKRSLLVMLLLVPGLAFSTDKDTYVGVSYEEANLSGLHTFTWNTYGLDRMIRPESLTSNKLSIDFSKRIFSRVSVSASIGHMEMLQRSDETYDVGGDSLSMDGTFYKVGIKLYVGD